MVAVACRLTKIAERCQPKKKNQFISGWIVWRLFYTTVQWKLTAVRTVCHSQSLCFKEDTGPLRKVKRTVINTVIDLENMTSGLEERRNMTAPRDRGTMGCLWKRNAKWMLEFPQGALAKFLQRALPIESTYFLRSYQQFSTLYNTPYSLDLLGNAMYSGSYKNIFLLQLLVFWFHIIYQQYTSTDTLCIV